MAKRGEGSRSLSLIAVITVQAILLPLFTLGGCTSTPKSLERQETHEKIPFSEILRSPEQYQGKVVRLGGVILGVVNTEQGSTLEVLEKHLNWRGRPKPGDDSGGRFLAVFGKFLDKAIYRPNRPVSITGEIIGMRVAPIGETTYNYPLLSGREIRLWHERDYYRPRLHIGIGASGDHVGVGVGTSF